MTVTVLIDIRLDKRDVCVLESTWFNVHTTFLYDMNKISRPDKFGNNKKYSGDGTAIKCIYFISSEIS